MLSLRIIVSESATLRNVHGDYNLKTFASLTKDGENEVLKCVEAIVIHIYVFQVHVPGENGNLNAALNKINSSSVVMNSLQINTDPMKSQVGYLDVVGEQTWILITIQIQPEMPPGHKKFHTTKKAFNST